ncbi:MAG: methyltransferase domain-containing protein [Azovibrio sp.]
MTAFVDLKQVRRNFRHVASTYGEADFLAREVDGRMLERLDYVRLTPEWIADLGCGPGLSLKHLQQRYPDALCLGVDQEIQMLPRTPAVEGWRRWLARPVVQPQYVAADGVQLPLKSNVLDLVWSNLLLPWVEEPRPLFREALRTLKVDGLFMFSTLGPDTLKELRSAFQDSYTHTQRFADMHDLGDMLLECGFADPVMDMEVLTLTYERLDGLVADLRRAGASCAMETRRRGLAGRTVKERLLRNYEACRRDGLLPATFEIVYGHAWKPEPKRIADGRSIIQFKKP